MEISQLALSATEQELTEWLQKALEKLAETKPDSPLTKLKQPQVHLRPDRAQLTCTAEIGFAVPVEAELSCSPSADGEAVEITLEKLTAQIAFGGGMITNGVMQLLTHAIEGKEGFSITGKTIRIQLAPLFSATRLQVTGKLREITLAPSRLSLLLQA